MVRAHKECETTKDLELRLSIGKVLEIDRHKDKRYPINAGVDCRFAVLAIPIKSRHRTAVCTSTYLYRNTLEEPCAGQECGLQCRLGVNPVLPAPCGACLAPLSPPTTVARAIEREPEPEPQQSVGDGKGTPPQSVKAKENLCSALDKFLFSLSLHTTVNSYQKPQNPSRGELVQRNSLCTSSLSLFLSFNQEKLSKKI
jgi:hypothetical protein